MAKHELDKNIINLEGTIDENKEATDMTVAEKQGVFTKIATGAKKLWSKPIVKTIVIGGGVACLTILGKAFLGKNEDEEEDIIEAEDYEIEDTTDTTEE